MNNEEKIKELESDNIIETKIKRSWKDMTLIF